METATVALQMEDGALVRGNGDVTEATRAGRQPGVGTGPNAHYFGAYFSAFNIFFMAS